MAPNYIQNHNVEDEVSSIRGGSLRRILAELADVFVAFILAATVYGLAFQNLFGYEKISKQMIGVQSEMTTILATHHLSFKQADGTVYLRDDFETQFIKYYLSKKSDAYTEDTKRDVLQQYYTTYRMDNLVKLSQFEYNTTILGLPDSLTGDNTSLFVYDESSSDPLNSEPVFSDESQAHISAYIAGNHDTFDKLKAYNAVKTLFNDNYTAALREVAENDSNYLNLSFNYYSLSGKRAYLQSSALIASYLVGTIITFLVVPIIKITGLTIGKRVAKLTVDDRDGNSANWWQIVIRFFVQTLDYCFLIPIIGIMGFGLSAFKMPLAEMFGSTVDLSVFLLIGLLLSLASLLLMFVTSNKQSLHDLASMTFVNTSDVKLIRDEQERRRASLEAKKENE